MKLKTAIILIVIACIMGAAHYNDPVTVSFTFPSPAQVVDAVGQAADVLKASAGTSGIGIEVCDSGQRAVPPTDTGSIDGTSYYRVRTSWLDKESQLGAYTILENAICNCPAGYFVYNEAGEIVYAPSVR